jgi:hypothetical protein
MGWDPRPGLLVPLFPTCRVQVRGPSAPLRGSSCAPPTRRSCGEPAAPAPDFWIPGSPSPMPSVSFIFSPVPGLKLAWGRGSGSGQDRVRGCWHKAGRCLGPFWGLVGGLERRLAPAACPLLAPHTVQFIHEPPRPALEGAVGRRFRRESRVGQRPCWRGRGRALSLLAVLST